MIEQGFKLLDWPECPLEDPRGMLCRFLYQRYNNARHIVNRMLRFNDYDE